jgi:hypothetical protein
MGNPMKSYTSPALIALVALATLVLIVVAAYVMFPVGKGARPTASSSPAPEVQAATATDLATATAQPTPTFEFPVTVGPPGSPLPTLDDSATAVLPLTSTSVPPQSALPTLGATAAATATATSTPVVTIVEDHTAEGMFLTLGGPGIVGEYRVGPLARGAYAVGPNGRFLIYVSNSGWVYGMRLGEGRSHFKRIVNLKRSLAALSRNDEPSYELTFVDAEYLVVLIIHERAYNESIPIWLPRAITY